MLNLLNCILIHLQKRKQQANICNFNKSLLMQANKRNWQTLRYLYLLHPDVSVSGL